MRRVFCKNKEILILIQYRDYAFISFIAVGAFLKKKIKGIIGIEGIKDVKQHYR